MKKLTLFLLLLVFTAGADAQTKKNNFAGSLKIGTPGIGISGNYKVAPKVNLRADINSTYGLMKFTGTSDGDGNDGNYDYNIEPNLFTGGVAVDYFIVGGLKATGGLYYNGNKVDVTLTPKANQTYNINGQTYSGSQLGKTTGKVEFPAVAPYLGIGYGNPVGSKGKVSFLFDLGVMYQGEADVTLTAPNNLKIEDEAEVRDQVKKYAKFYPVISFGVGYNF